MDRQFTYCPSCDDTLEVEYRRGHWYCENCGADLTKQVDKRKKKHG